MNTDLIVFIAYIGIFLVGFAAGRWERKDSYVRGYQRGKVVGSAIGRVEKENQIAQERYQELLAKRVGNDC